VLSGPHWILGRLQDTLLVMGDTPYRVINHCEQEYGESVTCPMSVLIRTTLTLTAVSLGTGSKVLRQMGTRSPQQVIETI
jgi:hypothetical protein